MTSVDAAPDGSGFAVGTDWGVVHVLDRGGAVLRDLLRPEVDPAKGSVRARTTHNSRVLGVRYLSDGRLMSLAKWKKGLAAAGSHLQVWDPVTGARLESYVLEGHNRKPCELFLAPDGKHMLFGSDSDVAPLWATPSLLLANVGGDGGRH